MDVRSAFSAARNQARVETQADLRAQALSIFQASLAESEASLKANGWDSLTEGQQVLAAHDALRTARAAREQFYLSKGYSKCPFVGPSGTACGRNVSPGFSGCRIPGHGALVRTGSPAGEPALFESEDAAALTFDQMVEVALAPTLAAAEAADDDRDTPDEVGSDHIDLLADEAAAAAYARKRDAIEHPPEPTTSAGVVLAPAGYDRLPKQSAKPTPRAPTAATPAADRTATEDAAVAAFLAARRALGVNADLVDEAVTRWANVGKGEAPSPTPPMADLLDEQISAFFATGKPVAPKARRGIRFTPGK